MNKEKQRLKDCIYLLDLDSKRAALEEAWNAGYEFSSKEVDN